MDIKRFNQSIKILSAKDIKILQKHRNLVGFVVNKYLAGRSFPTEFLEKRDLWQEGYFGLIQAVQDWQKNPRNNVAWSTFAVARIRAAIYSAVSNFERTMRVPQWKYKEITITESMYKELQQELGREPTADEIANELDLSVSEVNTLLDISRNLPLSLDQEYEGELTLGDYVEDVNKIDEEQLFASEALSRAWNRQALDDRERDVLYRSIVLEESYETIGEDLGITKQRISVIKSRALEKLRNDVALRRLDE